MRSDFVSFFLPVNYKMTSYISKKPTNKQTNKQKQKTKQNNKKKKRMFTYTHY